MNSALLGVSLSVLFLLGTLILGASARPLTGSVNWRYDKSWAEERMSEGFLRTYNLSADRRLNKKINIGAAAQFVASGANQKTASTYRISPFLDATEAKSKYKWALGIRQFQSATDEGNQRLDRNFTSTLGLAMPRYLPSLDFSTRMAQNFNLSRKSSESKELLMNSAYQIKAVTLRYTFQNRIFDNLAAGRATHETTRGLMFDYGYNRGFLLMPNSSLNIKYNLSNATQSSRTTSRSTMHFVNLLFNAALLPKLSLSNTMGYALSDAHAGGKSRQIENAVSLQGTVVENARWSGSFNQVRIGMGLPTAQKNNAAGISLALDPLPSVSVRLDANRDARYNGANGKIKTLESGGFSHLLTAGLYRDIATLSVKYVESVSRNFEERSSGRSNLMENKLRYVFSKRTAFDLGNRIRKERSGSGANLTRDYLMGGTFSVSKAPLTISGYLNHSKDAGRKSFNQSAEVRLNLGRFLSVTSYLDHTRARAAAGKSSTTSVRVGVVHSLSFALTHKLTLASTLNLIDIAKNNAGTLKIEVRSRDVEKSRLTLSYGLNHLPGVRDSNQLSSAYNLWF